MNALEAGFGFTVTSNGSTLSLKQGEHIRIYPTGRNKGFGERLTVRQIDLIRIATAVHVADGWARRRASFNRLRNVTLEVEVLDPAFWSNPETMTLLKDCVDFLSGGDDWTFCFIPSRFPRHDKHIGLFDDFDCGALVHLYSGGLDSASGLAARLAEEPGRMVIPVTVRHQMQKSQLVRSHFELLVKKGLTKWSDLKPFKAGAFIRNDSIKRNFDEEFREVTHRCRPFLFMSVAGLVAYSFNTAQVEVFESGVGSINYPLVSGPADYRTTRSTHPNFLRLISLLVSHVNDAPVRYVLPFADKTKGEMATRLRELDLEELARKSNSCILHPLQRKGWQQCGHCAACIFRRQALLTAGITEAKDAYAVDLFAKPPTPAAIPARHLRHIRAFHQQVAHLRELDTNIAPPSFRRYLRATNAVSSDAQLGPHVEVYRRYRKEWLPLIAEARRLALPWVTPVRSFAHAQGATS
jgi:7-cyano-7-deazaguanine synthase in queuosine biosynthesis